MHIPTTPEIRDEGLGEWAILVLFVPTFESLILPPPQKKQQQKTTTITNKQQQQKQQQQKQRQTNKQTKNGWGRSYENIVSRWCHVYFYSKWFHELECPARRRWFFCFCFLFSERKLEKSLVLVIKFKKRDTPDDFLLFPIGSGHSHHFDCSAASVLYAIFVLPCHRLFGIIPPIAAVDTLGAH